MKLTIFGLTISSSWGNGHATPYRALVRALSRLGQQVVFYEKDVDYYACHRDFHASDDCELVLYSSWAQIRGRALADAAESDAVVIGSYCPEGARIGDELLPLARPLSVFYDLDTPITLQAISEHDLDYLRRDQFGGFDLYLSFTGGEILQELQESWGVRLALPLYGCIDPDVYAQVPECAEFGCVLSYMGTFAADRQEKLEQFFLQPALRMPELTFLLAGSLYPEQWIWPPNVRRFEHVAPSEHAALYSSSHATLNITRAGMARTGYCPSGRLFEAAACCTPILSDWWEGLDTFFLPGEEILVVRDEQDVICALASDDLSKMATRARQRTLEDHTGDRRARQLLAYLEQARSRSGKVVRHRTHPGLIEKVCQETAP